MKKILFILLSFSACLSAFSQRTRVIDGYDPITGRPGYKYYDTSKTPVGISPIVYDGDSTFSLGTVPVTKGGTGITTLTTGDIFYASGTNLLSRLPIGTNGQTLQIAGGVPSWATVASGGGGGNITGIAGQIAYFNSSNAITGDTTFAYVNGMLTVGPPRNAIYTSALVRFASTTKGFLVPVMTSAQRDAIATPDNGLLIYNSDNSSFNVYTSNVWSTIASTSNAVLTTTDQTVGGLKTFNGNGGGAGIMLSNGLAIRGTASTGGNIYIDANTSIDNTGFIHLRGSVDVAGAMTFFNSVNIPTVTIGANGSVRGASASNGTIYMDASQDVSTGTFNFRATTVNLPSAVATKFSVSALNSAPASATATGTAGEIRFTSSGIYLCIATNSWLKFTGATF